MPFCPNCHTEFAAGVTDCADCGSELVASLATGWNLGRDPKAMQPVFLGEFTDQTQIGLVEAQLREAGIPFVRKPRVVGLFIPTSFLPRARQVLEGGAAGEPSGDSDTVCLSELHCLRLVCAQCEHELTVDLLAETLPMTCPECGRLFDLGAARPVLAQYTEVMRLMANADFEIELELAERVAYFNTKSTHSPSQAQGQGRLRRHKGHQGISPLYSCASFVFLVLNHYPFATASFTTSSIASAFSRGRGSG